MEKESEKWKSALQLPCGIGLDVPLCRSVGFSPVIQAGNVLQRLSFQRIRRKRLSRLFWILCARWSLESTFEESRAQLGVETQRQWSDVAIERTTPLLFSLSSLVALFGHALHPDGTIPVAQAAWYHKQTATFRDVFAVVRRHVWGNFSFPTSPTNPDVVLLPRSTLSRLAYAVCS